MIQAVIMVGERVEGDEGAGWVRGAQRAATADLITQLAARPEIDQIILASPDPAGIPDFTTYWPTSPGPIHVGQTLATIADNLNITRLLYYGGGSAPLLTEVMLAETVAYLLETDRGIITNNQFASDWAGIVPAGILADCLPRLPRDNMLGWVLSTEAGLPIHTFPADAPGRLDIDAPTDLLTLRLYPATQANLRRYLNALPLKVAPLQAALQVLATPASQVFIAGRIAPAVWSALNQVTRCWLRVIAEERGMVSSGRQARGEARSLLAAHLALIGPAAFFNTLADWSDAAFIDTRVLLAHEQRWPDAADRFASDLGQVDAIEDEWLRTFTTHALAAPIPVILGGHGLLAGNMVAFCELLAR